MSVLFVFAVLFLVLLLPSKGQPFMDMDTHMHACRHADMVRFFEGGVYSSYQFTVLLSCLLSCFP